MTLDEIRVRARIHLLAFGGRTTPLFGPGDYRPNHNFGLASGEMNMGFIELPTEQAFAPGETFDTEVTFLIRPDLDLGIQVGRNWQFQEGSRVIGTGTVLEMLSKETRDFGGPSTTS